MSRRVLRKQLIVAIEAGDENRVAEIAAADPSIVNAANSHGHVPLGAAIGTGCLERVKLLVAHGADPHYSYHGRSLFGCGGLRRSRGDISLSRFVRHATDRTPCRSHWRHSPAGADASGKSGLARAHGSGRPLAHYAAARGGIAGNGKSVAFLLARDVARDAENHNGHTALALTAEYPAMEVRAPIAKLLLAHGANVNAAAGHHGGTVLHRAVIHGDIALTGLLLEHGADPDRQDWSGKTPLHHAVTKNRKLVELLLAHAPNLAVESRDGETPWSMHGG